ncbi:hypothetical protein fugu_018898 [Takifugu bimaculatus]|uniref:DUF4174 domain-containing protein n=1 Tax=Takifugu bimaculatus TaxID=433685 RepID=A0A4Z2BK23_9TELE|nr:hypothetical protein fugu_018898 [Takifugu bimaculatus]
MVISTPSGDAPLYTQQREENEKHLCQLAARKITVATLVGGAALTLRHHQLEGEPALSGQSEHASEPGLISLLRAELGLSSSDLFSMTVTDYDMKPGRVFEAPPAAPALFQHIDSFPSRRSEKEKEKERKSPPPCSQRPPQPGADNSLAQVHVQEEAPAPLGPLGGGPLLPAAALRARRTGVSPGCSPLCRAADDRRRRPGERERSAVSTKRPQSDGDGAAVSRGHRAHETTAADQQGLLQPAVCGEGRGGEGLVPLPRLVPGQHLRPGGLQRDPPAGGEAAGEAGDTLPRRQRNEDGLRLQINTAGRRLVFRTHNYSAFFRATGFS